MDFIDSLWKQLFITSALEWIIVTFGFAYLILITRKKVAAWPCAIIGSLCSMYLCYGAQFYIEMYLSLFYVIMGIWGWYSWTRTDVKSEENDYKIKRWPISFHAVNICASIGVALLLGYLFGRYTNQSLPFLDAFIAVFSIAATFMVTQKVLENWIYWVVIDIASVQLYSYRDYYVVAFQMLVYSILAIYGYFNWRKNYLAQKKGVSIED